MIRAMIADDEFFIRKSFRNRFKWEKYGITIVGEAANGEEAYRQIPELNPNLIFVDIRMPVLDGLDLASLIHDTYPEIGVVLVTAFSDFEYAKRGIASGVLGYLTKPLNEQELDETLQRILPNLLERKQQAHRIAYGSAGEKFLAEKTFVCAAVREDGEGSSLPIEHRMPDIEVYHLVGEMFPMCQLYVLVGQAGLLKDAIQKAGRQDTIGNFDISMGLSSLFVPGGEERLTMAAAQAVQALKSGIFQTANSVHLYSAKDTGISLPNPYASSLISQAQNAFNRQEYNAGGQLLSSYLDSMQELKVEDSLFIETVVSVCLEQIFKASWERANTTEVKIQLNAFTQENYLLNFFDTDQLFNELKKTIMLICQQLQESSETSLSDRMVRYIQEHYGENLSMETLKKEFFMSSSSLLLEFKKNKGMTISAYIEAVRMEKAKELLATGVCSVSDTAEAVGYSDANYFARAFKRHTGVTPSQYRVMSGK